MSIFFHKSFYKRYVDLEQKLPRLILIRKWWLAAIYHPHDQPNQNRLHTYVFLGDSMTERLGNFDEIKRYLTIFYPNTKFLLLNYGYGATSILSAQDRLLRWTYHDRDFQPIIGINFDAIFIESFANNPLSQYPLEIGLTKQNQALMNIVQLIRLTHPKAQIIFVATVAPSKEKFGTGVVDLSKEKRAEWATERDRYIENHITFARTNNIPVIDVYHKSQDLLGNGDLDFLDRMDYIHPSPKGMHFISAAIASYIYAHDLIWD